MRLEVKDLHKSYSGNEVLHGISFQVESGRALGLLGRNGAGKTTTIRIIMNVFNKDSGSIEIDGKPFHVNEYKIGYLPEERGLYPKRTVMEQLVFFGCLRGMSKAQARSSAKFYLERLEIAEYANRKLETLSKGNQQKIQLAQTLITDPDLVIFDEPFSGLDPVNAKLLKDLVQECIEKGKLVIFSSHQMNYVEEFCEDVVIIHHGNIVLNGDLQAIKQDFGRGRLVLSTNVDDKIIAQLPGVKQIVPGKHELIIELEQGYEAQAFLETLVKQRIPVLRFGMYEPSLTEIFVEKAGDHA